MREAAREHMWGPEMLMPDVAADATDEEIIAAYVAQLGWSRSEAEAYWQAAVRAADRGESVV